MAKFRCTATLKLKVKKISVQVDARTLKEAKREAEEELILDIDSLLQMLSPDGFKKDVTITCKRLKK